MGRREGCFVQRMPVLAAVRRALCWLVVVMGTATPAAAHDYDWLEKQWISDAEATLVECYLVISDNIFCELVGMQFLARVVYFKKIAMIRQLLNDSSRS